MRPLAEVFLESEFDSSEIARQHRDERLTQLQAQGYVCRAENLYTIHTGMRIFTVIATPPLEATDLALGTKKKKTIPSSLPHAARPRSTATPKARGAKPGKAESEERRPRQKGDRH